MSKYFMESNSPFSPRWSEMRRKLPLFVCLGLLSVATGCEKKSISPMTMATSNLLLYPRIQSESPQRYIEESHKVQVTTTGSQLQKSWESLVAYCGKIQCEVTSSTITTKTSDSEPTGTVAMRVVPEDLSKLIAEVETLGQVSQHTTEREDKTSDVVDADARIKNLTTFRDSLRAMLAKPSVTVKDLIDIQQELTDTQSQLDTATAMRKVLANETEKIAVDVTFAAELPGRSTGAFAAIWEALLNSEADLADSTTTLIAVIVSVIPWLIVIVPGVWLGIRGWRRIRGRIAKATTSSTLP